MRHCRRDDFLFVQFSLVIIHDAVEHHFAAFEVPVQAAREPVAFRRPQAGECVSELPHRADEAARLWAASEEATGVRFDLDPVAVPAP